MQVGIERVDVVHRDQAAGHVPLVVPHPLVVLLDVRIGAVIGAEPVEIVLRIFVADRGIGIEAQHLVRTNRPDRLLVEIGLDELRAPVAVVAPDEAHDGDVVQQAGEDQLFRKARLPGVMRALQQVHRGAEAILEEIDQRRRLRHRGQARIVAHHQLGAGPGLEQRAGGGRRAHVAVGIHVQPRLDHDMVEFARHLFFQRIGALRQRRGGGRGVRHGALLRLLLEQDWSRE